MSDDRASTRVAVVIVNYRSGRLVLDALRALLAERAALPGLRVVVVDNASGDDSLEILGEGIGQESYADWVELLPSDVNGGFSAGNNLGIARALESGRPDFFLLHNPDAAVRPGAIVALVDFLRAHSKVGIAGSQLEDANGRLEVCAHPFPSPLRELSGAARLGPLDDLLGHRVERPHPLDEPEACDWVTGASLMLRTEVFEQVGPMDEGYFLYFDEVDYCHRARSAGWQVYTVPDSRVTHTEGSTTGIARRNVRRSHYWYDSRRRFLVKAYGVVGLIAADLLWGIGRLSLELRSRLGMGGDLSHDPAHCARALLGGDVQALFAGRPLLGDPEL